MVPRRSESIMAFRRLFIATLASAAIASAQAWAQSASIAFPAASEASGQRPGSILIYNLYSSGASDPNHDTRVSLTNSSATTPTIVHVSFVAGSNGATADTFLCLAANQTRTFRASEFDPAVTGYIVAVAVDSNGCPAAHNHLLGDASVKLPTGHTATMNAIGVAAQFSGTLAGCTNSSTTATLNFDGTSYNQLPRVLGVDRLRSPQDGNSTQLVVNRIGGDLGSSLSAIGAAQGILYNQAGSSFPFSFNGSGPQFRSTLNDSFPVTTPVYSSALPAGKVGWMKLHTTADSAIVGAVVNFNANSPTASTAFTGGHNLRALSLGTTSLSMPVQVPGC